MMNRIRIQSFRGLSDLTIDDCGLVNIFVGGNGVGKTSVLEALAIALYASNPSILGSLALWREFPGLQLGADHALRTLFPGMDVSSPITIETEDGKNKNRLKIEAIRDAAAYTQAANGKIVGLALPATVGGEEAQTLLGVNYTYHNPQNQTRTASLLLRPDSVLPLVKIPFATPGCFYIHARRATSVEETARVITRLLKNKQRDTLLNALRLIEPRVMDVLVEPVAGGNIVSVDIGLPRYVPMNTLGDGFCRTALMITGMLSSNSKTLIVDEVDSGLHHSVMESFWRCVLDLSSEFKFQLFCTTHSDEMLHHSIEAFKDSPEKLRVFRLDRAADGHISVTTYTYADLRDSDFAGFEIRGRHAEPA